MNTNHATFRTLPHHARGKSPLLLLCFLLALMGLRPPLLDACTKTEKIRVSLAPEREVRVGQKVSLNIDLMTTTWFSGAPVFELPEIPGAVVLKVGSFGVNRTETVKGVKYSVQGHEFAIFVQRPGALVIPPFNVRFFPARTGGAKPGDVTLKTPELSTRATMPPGAENLESLISTEQFEVSERWDPAPETARVGDAFTRTITMRAEDVPGMAFPPLEVADIKGFGIYSRTPAVNDKMDRGSFTGERTETITYVCEEAGTATLPEIVFHWWDLENEALKTETLPAVKLKVKPNPKLFKETGPAALFSSHEKAIKWMVLLVAVAAAGLAVFVWYRASLVFTIKAWKAARKESEKSYFNHFKAACRSGNHKEAYARLLSWLDKIGPGDRPGTLDGLVAASGTPALAEQAALLKSELFKEAGQENPRWDSRLFLQEIAKTRRQWLKNQAHRQARVTLPDLNPS